MRKKRLLILTLCLALSAALVCGCGAGGGAGGGTGGTSAAGNASEAGSAAGSLESENAALRTENEALRKQLEQAGEPTASGESDNPIDVFFDGSAYRDNGTTAVMNLVAERYRRAWKAELLFLAADMKEGLSYDEDRELVDDYLETVEEQAAAMDNLAPLSCGDTSAAPADRAATLGTIYGSLLGNNGAQVYKNAFFQLLNVSVYAQEGGYSYSFDADTEKGILDAAIYGG